MKKIIIIGSGGHANSVLDVVLSLKKFKFSGFVDKNKRKPNVIGSDRDLNKIFKKIKYAVIGVGQIQSSDIRKKLFSKLKKIGYKLPTIISSTSYVSRSASIGEGTVVMHGAIINSNAKVGKNNIINSKALLEHDVLIGDHCHVSTNSTINGYTEVGDNTFIGSNATLVNNIKIAKSKFIKAGSLIKRSLK